MYLLLDCESSYPRRGRDDNRVAVWLADSGLHAAFAQLWCVSN